MLITYLIFLLLGVTFKVMHWPGASLILLASIVFPIIDIIVQGVKNKPFKTYRILSAITIVFTSLFLLFKFQHWPGNIPIFIIAFALAILSFIVYFKTKVTLKLRMILTGIIIAFSLLNFSMSPSTFTLFYLKEDPFNSEELLPSYYTHRLARELYLDGKYDDAEKVEQATIIRLQRKIEEENYYNELVKKAIEENVLICKKSLEQIKAKNWQNFEILNPEF